MNKSKLIQLPKIVDPRGNLSFFEFPNQLPFNINRVYWIYDVPGGEIRGSHAYKEQHEIIIALSGSFDVEIDNGISIERYSLNRSYYGLYVPNLLWRTMQNFSTNSLALVISSSVYNDQDYIRDYNEFITLKKSR